ncbi:hypothetical protein [endosymbiont 'TC1' of Trimyema compressum]|uniref:hypothetical protein n=1 Tax=endosymbiont 'TC1' of Trimyema compressum TaxID=243899 RepID=UPI00155F221E|nr:hypothetical protein [endosymbiont 'TC1' of Trimyema compressum]
MVEEKGCRSDFQKWYVVQMAIRAYIKNGCQTIGSCRKSVGNHSDAAVYYGYHHILDYVSQTDNLISFTKPNIQLSVDDEDTLKSNITGLGCCLFGNDLW